MKQETEHKIAYTEAYYVLRCHGSDGWTPGSKWVEGEDVAGPFEKLIDAIAASDVLPEKWALDEPQEEYYEIVLAKIDPLGNVIERSLDICAERPAN